MGVIWDPIGFVKSVVKSELMEIIRCEIKDFPEDKVQIVYPPDPSFGDLSAATCFLLAKKLKRSPTELAKEMAEKLSARKIPYIGSVEALRGYINFRLDYPAFSRFVLSTILTLKDKYGFAEIGKGKKVIVEHTSANPIHPLHIGTARNAIIGDSLARIYRFLGYDVETRFYVNDMGRQVAYLVYGFSKIKSKPTGKPDHWLGAVYSVTSIIIEELKARKELSEKKKELINLLNSFLAKIKESTELLSSQYILLLRRVISVKKKAEELVATDWIKSLNKLISSFKKIEDIKNDNIKNELKKIVEKIEEIKKVVKKLEDWSSSAKSAKLKWPEIYGELERGILKDEDPEAVINKLIREYELGNNDVASIFKKICNAVIEGFKKTLERIDVYFDAFDWESELVRSGLTDIIIKELEEKGWTYKDATGALYLNLREALLKREDIRQIFNITLNEVEKAIKNGKAEDVLPPNLVLRRKDGTTLYTTRDIAYALYKLKTLKADIVLNVIGKDQTLAQKQLLAALALTGHEELVRKYIHVAYELVVLPGEKMSARRGRYITFDEILDEAEERAYEEVNKRAPDMPEEEKRKIAESVGAGAVRYALISVSPDKVITFDWNRVLDFERNSGPFLQYAYARATSIIRKNEWKIPSVDVVDFSLLKEPVEIELIKQLSMFPETVLRAAQQIRPDIIAEYANKISQFFNSFYQQYPVLKAPSEDLKNARLILVEAFRITLGNSLRLLGIKPLERM
ncbi:MAG: arginine--tRNA ligase [Candidatus Njordarchaeales archaeon]